MVLLFFWLFIFLVIVSLFCFLIHLLYFRSSNGIILFKIDPLNKRVIRQSAKYFFLSTIFDSKKSEFKKYNYISLNYFKNFFHYDSAKKIDEILQEPIKKKYSLNIILNEKIHKEFNFLEKIIFKLDQWFHNYRTYKLNMELNEKHEFICNIEWKKEKKINPIRITNSFNEKQVNIKKGSYKIIGLALKTNFLYNELSNTELKEIFNLLNLSHNNIQFFKKEELLFILIKKNIWNIFSSNKTELIINLNKNILFSKYFLCSTILDRKITSSFDLNEIEETLLFSLYHILAKPENKNDFLNLSFNYNNSDIQIFSEELRAYKTFLKNFRISDNLDKKYIYKLKDIEKTDKYFLDWNLSKNLDYLTFYHLFVNNPYLQILKENMMFNSLLKNENNLNQGFLKLSIDSLHKLNFYKIDNFPTILLYSINYEYNQEILKDFLLEMNNKNKFVGLYIENINDNLCQFINDNEINYLILAKNISMNLIKDYEIYLNCLKLRFLTKNKNLKIIYENLNEKIDSIILKKVNINYFYKL
ncbi:MHO_4530 family protein [Mycoplasmopsis felis]|uniref:MHO_4530 family protein n=1 Tax=Mycoplasmopsis felis TaxID=33923 RepID=UPI003AF3C68E